jgi:DNA transformation protein and related proteins
MASQQSIVDLILEQAAGAGSLRARKMFGEYAIYRSDKMIALVCDDRLFVKPTEAGRKMLGVPVEDFPYPNAKLHFVIGEEFWEDRDLLAALLVATDRDLPPPKPKTQRGKKPS